MDQFPDGTCMRLRGRVRRARAAASCLHADEDDGEWVSLRPLRRDVPALNAVWRVHRVVRDGIAYVLLDGAAYGRYLALSPGQEQEERAGNDRGVPAIQRGYDARDLDAVICKPVVVAGANTGGYVYNGNLRAAVDEYLGTRRSTMRHWKVEVVVVPPRQGPPPALRLPTTTGNPRDQDYHFTSLGGCRKDIGSLGIDGGDGGEEPLLPLLIVLLLLCDVDDTSSEVSWKHVLGYPMVQTVPGTCALVAATVCLEAQHRLEFEKEFGAGTFPCRAAAPRKLRAACYQHRYWNTSTKQHYRAWDPEEGGDMEQILNMIMRLGGVRTTNAPPPAPFFLPLASWEHISCRDTYLTTDEVVQELFEHGPCIGLLFTTAQFFRRSLRSIDTAFRGCRREDREKLQQEEPSAGNKHAVVCYAYRRPKKTKGVKGFGKKEGMEGQFDILVLDNQPPIGLSRWVEYEEFDYFIKLNVYGLPRRHLLDRARPPVYPESRYS